MKKFLYKLACLVGAHSWTCDQDQGIKPDKNKMKADPMGYWRYYSRMYCLRCGKIYKPPQ